MANSRPLKRFLGTAACRPVATTGVFTDKVTANILSFNKAAAATVSVVNFSVPKQADAGAEDRLVKSVALSYSPSTANLTSAPTVIINKLTTNLTTGAVTRTAVTATLAFSGTDTVGLTAAGTYLATATITTPAQIGDNEELVVSFTMNEAATSVLDIYGIIVDYSG